MGAVDAVVETAEVIDEVVEAVEHINNLNGTTRKQQIIVLVAVGVGAAIASGAVSHFVTKKLMRTKFEAMLEEELEKTREFYHEREVRASLEVPQPEDPEVILANLKESTKSSITVDADDEVNEFLTSEETAPMLEKLQKAAAKGKSAVAVEKRSVFEESEEGHWVASNERKAQTKQPHIISKDAYMENELSLFQINFTYFDGDGVLADEKEAVVQDVDKIVGEENLSRFGWLSEDQDTVYIRNEDFQVEIEVTRSEGKYASEVLGFGHSDDTFERKARKGRVRYGDE